MASAVITKVRLAIAITDPSVDGLSNEQQTIVSNQISAVEQAYGLLAQIPAGLVSVQYSKDIETTKSN